MLSRSELRRVWSYVARLALGGGRPRGGVHGDSEVDRTEPLGTPKEDSEGLHYEIGLCGRSWEESDALHNDGRLFSPPECS